MNLQSLAFKDAETVRNIILHGAVKWLLENLETNTKEDPVPRRENDKHPLMSMFTQTITVLETVGVPTLSILLGEKISFESYHLVQRALGSICGSVGAIQEFITRLVKEGIPYADEYFECLEIHLSCERHQNA